LGCVPAEPADIPSPDARRANGDFVEHDAAPRAGRSQQHRLFLEREHVLPRLRLGRLEEVALHGVVLDRAAPAARTAAAVLAAREADAVDELGELPEALPSEVASTDSLDDIPF
jgi:hypothetical protein